MTNKPQYRQEWIFELLKLEGLSYGEIFSKFSVKFSKTERTFNEDWKVANERYKSYQSDVNKAKNDASISYEVKSLKQGLKSKFERTLNLQNQIDHLQNRLDKNLEYDYIVVDKKIQKVERSLTVSETAVLIREIKGLSALIGTNQGDPAPKEIKILEPIEPISFTIHK